MQANFPKRILGATLAAVLLAACHPKVTPPPPPSVPESTPVDVKGATRYDIASAASDVHILVYRGGAMARLGHNHVVSSKELTGRIWLNADLAHSRVELKLPVNTLSVDDPKARAAEGEDFAAEVPQDARDGTRKNLLRTEVLDGERFQTIVLASSRIGGTLANPELSMKITIKGVTRDVPVRAQVKEEGDRLTAKGEFAVEQSEFGITPFSVALGALQVQDQLKIKFSIVGMKQK